MLGLLIVLTTNIDSLRANLSRWTLILGVLQITVGCLVGFIPPSAVEWFRGIVMAHIEFTANGVLMVAFGFLVRELRLGPVAIEGVVRNLADWHLDKRGGGCGGGFHRRYFETPANAQ